ncbi:hypothetical protein B484DRAFT_459805 [Ochromonadaceae sp. CCMP2298]|nr:hypothetical protein B484DRAFT_459805 [Ochromonadaceae sp. CCMP2298]|mmetsp:Transcript_11322/g.25190  ORF Transcript_11322/g.25190 Transcript_11322/m.25190 type:complete len:240 (+) Transcript_11322:199-918(+)
MHDRGRGRNRQTSPILISLLFQLYAQLERTGLKPPVTIALLALNILVHVAPSPHVLQFDLTDLRQNCVQPSTIVYALFQDRELLLNRLVLAALIHADDMHLYYNMLSLCWKGVNLETQLGSAAFLKLVIFSVLTAHALLVLGSLAMHQLGLPEAVSGYHSCAVGFSAVLFSMKAVWNASAPGETTLPYIGIRMPTKYAAWGELLLASLLSPRASFIGHLAGILAGQLYVLCLRHRAFMR